MTTRAGLLSLLRETLGDRAAWPDASLHAWIAGAVREYSNYFPRRTAAAISCTAAVRTYSLAACTGIQAAVLVEYPQGAAPPIFLERRPESSPNFYGAAVYDLRGSPPHTLVLGQSPAAGQSIELHYTCDHTPPADDTSALTIPDRHLNLVVLFVHWQAVRELELAEALNPDDRTLLLSALRLTASSAEAGYRARLQDLLAAGSPTGCAGPWLMDDRDRIY